LACALIFNANAYGFTQKQKKTAHEPNMAVYQLNGVKNGK